MAALALPVAIGTIVVIYRTVTDDDAPAASSDRLGRIAPFGTTGFRVNDDPTAYCALLAATPDAQQQGMQNRSDLGGYDAMVFAFDSDQTVPFINHFVPIDLDIGWYDSRGVLVDFATMQRCPDGVECPTFAARDPFRYAVETPAGGLSALGLASPGATLQLGGGC